MIYDSIKSPDTSHVYDLMPRESTIYAQIISHAKRGKKKNHEINVVVKITISIIIKLMRY